MAVPVPAASRKGRPSTLPASTGSKQALLKKQQNESEGSEEYEDEDAKAALGAAATAVQQALSGAGQRVRQSMVEASHVLDLLQSKQGRSEKAGENSEGQESFGKTSSIGSNASRERRQIMRASSRDASRGASRPSSYSQESRSSRTQSPLEKQESLDDFQASGSKGRHVKIGERVSVFDEGKDENASDASSTVSSNLKNSRGGSPEAQPGSRRREDRDDTSSGGARHHAEGEENGDTSTAGSGIDGSLRSRSPPIPQMGSYKARRQAASPTKASPSSSSTFSQAGGGEEKKGATQASADEGGGGVKPKLVGSSDDQAQQQQGTTPSPGLARQMSMGSYTRKTVTTKVVAPPPQ